MRELEFQYVVFADKVCRFWRYIMTIDVVVERILKHKQEARAKKKKVMNREKRRTRGKRYAFFDRNKRKGMRLLEVYGQESMRLLGQKGLKSSK